MIKREPQMPITPVVTEFAHMRVLVVGDDVAGGERLAQSLSQAGYGDIVTCAEPADVQHLCVTEQPALVLFDLDMGELSYEALATIRHRTNPPQSLPVIGVSADSTPDARHRALSMGVRDFVTKPIDETELLFRVHNALQTRWLQTQLEDRDAVLSQTVRERTNELDTVRESLSVLAAIADYNDDDTYQHAQRVGIGASLIAQALGLPESFVNMIRDAAPLHDLGKVGLSRRILLKPGKLTPSEWIHMMRHVEIGAQILASARSPVLQLAAEIARTHHERWDGNGYVAGLVGAETPVAGRITALADVWDTLTHERPYKPAWDEDRALAEITGQAGAHFDPRMVDAFLTIDWHALSEPVADTVAGQAA
jgi:putative two-component system response regulator